MFSAESFDVVLVGVQADVRQNNDFAVGHLQSSIKERTVVIEHIGCQIVVRTYEYVASLLAGGMVANIPQQ